MEMAATGSSGIVNGSSSATAMGELNPGNAPTTTPMSTPKKIRPMLNGSASSDRPSKTGSIGRSYRKSMPYRPGSK